MKKEIILKEEDFLQQFPHQSLFEESVEEIPEWYELDQTTAQNLKPFNFAELHQAPQQQMDAIQSPQIGAK